MKELVQNASTGKKYLHNLVHENHTTGNFGFVQPLMVNERAARDVVSLRCGQSVFLNPMSKPTFGRVSCKTYESFVPIIDIWHPFESFLSGQSYHGSDADYVPSTVPTVQQNFLMTLLLYGSNVKAFTCVVDSAASGEIIGYHNVIPITVAADQVTCKSEFQDYLNSFLTNVQGFDFSDTPTQNHLIPPHFEFPTTAPYQNYEESDFLLTYTSSTTSYVMFVNLTQEMRNIRKILLGCGYQINMQPESVSLLPLFAYFKAYFDLFNPNRDRTWKETYAFKFMEFVEQHNDAQFSDWIQAYTSQYAFLDFFKNLAYCYYTQNPDYVSAHINNMSLDISTQGTNSINSPGGDGTIYPIDISQGEQPLLSTTASSLYNKITQNRLDILKVLYHRANAASAIGGDVRAFLKAFYGNSEFEEPESNYIGSQQVPVNISTVVSQAQTSDGDLGEYAARGIADDGGNKFTFECRTQGFIVVLSTFVPECRYAQGVDPQLFHKGKYDFFTPALDSKTLLPTRKAVVHGAQEFLTVNGGYVEDLSAGFGNIPNYFEYKVKQNVLNGDMSLASKRSSYLPFTLDKLMPWRSHTIYANGNVRVSNFSPSLLVASSKWRYIGLDGWLGWFNRIFINSGNDTGDYRESSESRGYPYMEDIDDNFILYTYLDYKVSSFALPTQSSFQTVDEGDDTFAVEKA